jgi:hypothetical protein
LSTLVDPALEVIYECLTSKKTPHATRLAAANDILVRTGFKPVEKHEHEIALDGDLSTLSEEALERATYCFERIVFGEDKARLSAEKRRALLEAGAAPDIVDAEFAVAPATEQEEDRW